MRGGGAQAPDRSRGALAAALLSARDVPKGYLPAADQPVFGDLRATDPDCRDLLARADLAGLDGARVYSAVFYNADPGATLAERVTRLPGGRAAEELGAARSAAAGCPQLLLSQPVPGLVLGRRALRHPGGRSALGVRYTGVAGRFRANFDIVMARAGDVLLVIAHPAVDRDGRSSVTERVAGRALRKLRAAP